MTLSPPRIWTDVDLVPEALELLATHRAVVTCQPEGSLLDIEDAEALIVGSHLHGDAPLFARTPYLRALARVGIGFDRIDVKAATDAGICAMNTPDAPTESTATFAITLMLAVARRLLPGAVPLAGGHWTQGGAVVGFDLAGKTLGLVGCGRIGRRVAELAVALHLNVQAFDPLAPTLPAAVQRCATLPELLVTSDVVSLHVPSTPATRHLIDAPALASMKPDAILINTARGPLVDEAALFAALKRGHLFGVGLDVWDPEPPARELPLLRIPNVVATPHMAAATREGRRRSHVAAADQVLAALRGERPPSLLNPEVWPKRRPVKT